MKTASDEKIITYIRALGTEFKDVVPTEIDTWIEMTKPLVSKKLFGDFYELAVAYLVCHQLKLAGYGDPSAFGMKYTDMLVGGSVSEGGVSVSFGTNPAGNLQKDAEYGLTIYGMRYLELRRRVIVPIRVRGESGG